MNLLAFDLGASNGKVFLARFNGKLLNLELVRRFENNAVTVKDDLFWDVLYIFSELKAGIADGLRITKKINSIGLDSFSNDFGLLDRNGHFINQVHTYRDQRTKRNEQKIFEIMPKERIHKLSGNQVALFPTLMQLAAMKLEDQGYLLDGSCCLLFLPDLFTYFLTGSIGSEYTISSVSQLLDFDNANWNRDILDAFRIPSHLFAPILMPGSKVGKITDKNLVNGQVVDVIAVCEHDTASAFLAAPFGEDSIIISSGTWSLVGVEVPRYIINDFTFEHNIANEGGYPGHHRLLKNVMGLWLIQECRRSYAASGQDFSFVELMHLAAMQKPFKFMINPNNEQFFSPGNMPDKIVKYCLASGQGRPKNISEVIRCIVESLALQYRLVIEELEAVSNSHYEQINIVGGGSNNRLLNQCVADATGRRVVAGPEEATAVGNLLVQLMAQGEISNVNQGRQVVKHSFSLEIFEPCLKTGWDERFAIYKQMIQEEVNSDGQWKN